MSFKQTLKTLTDLANQGVLPQIEVAGIINRQLTEANKQGDEELALDIWQTVLAPHFNGVTEAKPRTSRKKAPAEEKAAAKEGGVPAKKPGKRRRMSAEEKAELVLKTAQAMSSYEEPQSRAQVMEDASIPDNQLWTTIKKAMEADKLIKMTGSKASAVYALTAKGRKLAEKGAAPAKKAPATKATNAATKKNTKKAEKPAEKPETVKKAKAAAKKDQAETAPVAGVAGITGVAGL